MTIATKTIRQATRPDMYSLYSLIKDVYDSTEMMCEQFLEKYPDIESLQADFDDTTGIAGSLFLVSEDAFGLCGYITVKPMKQSKLAHTAYINMGVSERARGKSVGRHLLKEALEIVCRQEIVEILYLNVREDNTPAVKLYEAFNFETIARLDRDTKIGDAYFTGLLMRRFIV